MSECGSDCNMIHNLLPPAGEPSQSGVESYQSFIDNLLKGYVNYWEECNSDCDSDCDDCGGEPNRNVSVDDLRALLQKELGADIKFISCEINYPCEKPFVHTTATTKTKVTHGMLLWRYTCAYQVLYATVSNGNPYGVWGHTIGDLAYNGDSDIRICCNTVTCTFECDS